MADPDPDRFLLIPDLYGVAATLGQMLDDWVPEYLSAVERQAPDLEPGQLKRPGRARVRHAGYTRRGEQTPALIVWPEGVGEYQHDPSGSVFADVELSVLVIGAAGGGEDTTSRLVHRLASAVRALLLHRPIRLPGPAGDVHHRLWPTDEDDTAIDPTENGIARAGITLSCLATAVYLGRRDGGPPPDAEPRPDPHPPWPPGPTIELPAHVQIDPVDPDAPLFPAA